MLQCERILEPRISAASHFLDPQSRVRRCTDRWRRGDAGGRDKTGTKHEDSADASIRSSERPSQAAYSTPLSLRAHGPECSPLNNPHYSADRELDYTIRELRGSFNVTAHVLPTLDLVRILLCSLHGCTSLRQCLVAWLTQFGTHCTSRLRTRSCICIGGTIIRDLIGCDIAR
ncbi:hypothetical protein BV25DRAFT_774592 [Artomyces pyxidatus]|uniref:Uncharacterized protein n=1 Tax=Artomyces pyxidatus TaxID=48021 RepID=A0ACB8SXI6_9AGAM|nr:hypothetical protein BV25DRAFT_774592 [Artomyces pyxidatus]